MISIQPLEQVHDLEVGLLALEHHLASLGFSLCCAGCLAWWILKLVPVIDSYLYFHLHEIILWEMVKVLPSCLIVVLSTECVYAWLVEIRAAVTLLECRLFLGSLVLRKVEGLMARGT